MSKYRIAFPDPFGNDGLAIILLMMTAGSVILTALWLIL